MIKKSYLFLTLLTAFLWLGSGTMRGESPLTVADGTNKNAYVPLYGNWADAYQHFQVIYPAADLADMNGQQITSMKFYISSNSTVSKVWNGTYKIRLAETEATYFEGAFINVTSNPVYTGSLDGRTREVLITFTEAYTYNGGNLLFDLQDETYGDNYNDASFLGVGQGYSSAVGNYSSTSVAAVTATNRAFIPKTTFTYEAQSSCTKPTDLTKGAITANSAAFSWTAGGNESEWQYLCLPAAEEANWEGADVKTATSASVTVEGLNPSTEYKFYVRANCGGSDGQSAAISVAFKTPCVAISALPASFNFDNETVDEIPDCWDRIAYETSWYGTMPKVYGSGAYGGSGKCIYFYGGGSSSSSAIILPAFAEKTGKLAISFQYNNGNTYASYGFAQIGYMTDPADASTFVMLKQLDKADAYSQVANYPLTGAPDNAYIAIRYAGGSSDYGSLYIDNITVDLAPSCIAPSAPVASDVTTNSAQLSWNAGGTETAWEMQYSVNNEDWLDVNNGNAVTNPYVLEGLDPATMYYVRVKAVCSATDESGYSESSSFRTDCDVISALPWNYGFEDDAASAAPACWQLITYYDDWDAVYYPYVAASGAYAGSKVLYFVGGGSAATSPVAILPQFSNDISSLVLSFYYKATTGNSYAKLKVGYITNPTDASTFVAIETLEQASAYTHVGPFGFAGAPANAYMAIQYTGGTSNYGAAYVDAIHVEEAPSCMQPGKPAAAQEDITANSAIVTWAAGGSESAWKLQYKAANGEWSNDIAVNAASYTLTNLSPVTTYYVRVKAVCGDQEVSEWSAEGDFTTDCGTMPMPFEENFSSSSAYPSCWNASPNTGNYRWAPYSEYVSSTSSYNYEIRLRGSNASSELSTPSIELSEDAVLKFRWKNGSSTKITANVYISKDGGATRELLPNDLSTKVSSWTNKTIDLSDYTGETVIIYFVSATGNSTSSYAYLDDVQVIAKPCEGPTGLAAAPTVDGGTISWIGSAKALRYKTGSAEWTTISVSGSAHTLTGLLAETAYQVQVQAACAASDDEAWSASLSFTTKCAPSNVLPYENDFENEALNDMPACWDRISASAYPQVVSGAAAYGGSGKALYFYGNTDQKAVLPAFTQALKTLTISFYYKSNYSSHYEIGYLEADGATFHSLASLPASTSFGSEPYELDLASISDDAAYLAILYTGATSTYATGYIDNVVVRKTPTCFKPASVTVESYTDNSAVINWTASGKGESQYQYVCVLANATPNWNEATLTNQLTATVENLAAHSAYEFYVRSYCSEEDQSDSISTSFTTKCAAAALPFDENFDAVADYDMPECWNMFSATNYAAYVANGQLQANAPNTNATVIVLPEMATTFVGASILFNYRTNNGTLKVGYVTDAEDKTTFVPVSEALTANTMTQVVVPFTAGSGNIALSFIGNTGDGDLYLDDIRIANIEVFNDADNNAARLVALNGQNLDVVIGRTLVAATYFNTICLPFDVPTLDGTPLEGGDLWAFKYAVEENSELLFRIVEASSIEAGKPYFIAFPDNTENIVNPLFKNVTISATAGQEVGNDVAKLCGIVDQPVVFTPNDQTKLFLAANNTLYWWAGSENSQLNNFRAYFKVNTGSNAPARYGMPARIIKGEQHATGIDNAKFNDETIKRLENNQVIIIRNGVKYNIQGQVIQ